MQTPPTKIAHAQGISQWLASSLKRWFVASMYNQNVWTPTVRELSRRKEHGNTQDPFAVAVLDGTVLPLWAMFPPKISSICSMFLQREGTIMCIVTGSCRRYSVDLPQGGLGNLREKRMTSTAGSENVPPNEPLKKKRELEDAVDGNTHTKPTSMDCPETESIV